MKKVTRDIDPGSAQDLLERAPRACISFASDQGPQVYPVRFQWQEDRYLISLSAAADALPDTGQEVVLLVDEGTYYFELRAIYIRGLVKPADSLPGRSSGRNWFEVDPHKVVAWDYGRLREEGHER